MDDIFRSYIIPAIIAALVGIISSIITNRTTNRIIQGENERLKSNLAATKAENDKLLSAEYISNERIRWIQDVRNTFADFRAHTTVAVDERAAGIQVINCLFEINREASYLKLLLKGYGEYEMDIKCGIDRVVQILILIKTKESTLKEFMDEMDELTKLIQIYLKVEWERVKSEIKGEKWDSTAEIEMLKKVKLLFDTKFISPITM